MMGKIALISDVHANLEAIEAVLSDIEKSETSDIISLGDNVGYGPNPAEVLKRLHEKNIFSLEGNHDLAVVNPKSFADATDLALDALEWTRLQLVEAVKKDEKFEAILENYLGMPEYCILPDDPHVILVHGCPGEQKSRFEYLLSPEDLIKPSYYMKKKNLKVCFFGHTHRQVLWEVDPDGVSLIESDINEPIVYSERELANRQILINPGSVGQPRDENPDAAYVIYERTQDARIFTFKRVAYDVEKTVQKIYAIRALDNRLGDRLVLGA
jgi:predicted phosphodiesterase